MWELNHKKDWVLKIWCFWTVVLEKTLESPLDCREIKLVNPKGNQSQIFIGRTDVEAEAPILWPPDVKNQLTGKSLMFRKIQSKMRRGSAEDEMVRQYHQLNGHEFEQTLGDSEGQGSWQAVVRGILKSQTQFGDWSTTNYIFFYLCVIVK